MIQQRSLLTVNADFTSKTKSRRKASRLRLQAVALASSLLLFASCSGKPETIPLPQTTAYGKLSSQKLKPRGGTTTGPKVKLASGKDSSWEKVALAESLKAKDRAAILAMAGEYRASFEFAETGVFSESRELSAPYQSWATEKIYLLEESEDFISLQHVLVMDFVMNGKVHGPFVMKHWRQDWSWQPERIFQYSGNMSWTKKELSLSESRGKWLQEVFHVDDSPRYSSLGSWEHFQNFSRWRGEQTARPLPRREKVSGLDYKVLFGSNIQTIAKNQWLHEQHNYKCQGTSLDNCQATETGVNSYQRIEDYDFREGDKYMRESAPYWDSVRDHWSRLFSQHEIIKLKERVENREQFEKHFEMAEKSFDSNTAADIINSFVDLAR